jgi:hypothetical protein
VVIVAETVNASVTKGLGQTSTVDIALDLTQDQEVFNLRHKLFTNINRLLRTLWSVSNIMKDHNKHHYVA